MSVAPLESFGGASRRGSHSPAELLQLLRHEAPMAGCLSSKDWLQRFVSDAGRAWACLRTRSNGSSGTCGRGDRRTGPLAVSESWHCDAAEVDTAMLSLTARASHARSSGSATSSRSDLADTGRGPALENWSDALRLDHDSCVLTSDNLLKTSLGTTSLWSQGSSGFSGGTPEKATGIFACCPAHTAEPSPSSTRECRRLWGFASHAAPLGWPMVCRL
mmetsp:Transcript_49384/g.131008  ORF Transcript_49384/g.131008 Transcript_49384/m.131008 type:complete len:218 (+) Transcript_49384:1001-1654(+)